MSHPERSPHSSLGLSGPLAGWGAIVALAQLSNPGAVIGTLSPTFVNAFVSGGASLTVASRLAAAEFFAMALTLLGAPALVNRWDRRMLAIFALITAAAAQLLSIWVGPIAVVGLCRAAAGVGEGALYAVAIASLSGTATPDRAFGVAIASNQIAGTALLALIARASRASPSSAAMLITGIFILVNVVFIPVLRRRGRAQESDSTVSRGKSMDAAGFRSILCGLAGMFLLSGGFGAVWPIVGQIALAHDVSNETIAATFSVVGFGGVTGGIAATLLGIRFGRLAPLIFGTTGMVLCLLLTLTSLFVAATILIMFFWAFNLPYFFGPLADLDKSGRLAVMTGSMIPFGIAAGQMVAGPIVALGGFSAVTVTGSIALVASLFAMQPSLRRVVAGSEAVTVGR
jgi:predicted MFS family arabinose efflux permease